MSNSYTILHTHKVELASKLANGNMVAKFILCDFDANKNKVKLNRDTIENWYKSIVNQPLVGKIIGNDFSSHRMKTVTKVNKDGEIEKSVQFDTEAFGVFTSADIETIDNVEYITATAEIWQRYPKACDLIERRISEGTLYTSWEILTNESHEDNGIKVIDDGLFTAHCLLASTVEPAYDSSRLLEVAEANRDDELISALTDDLANNKEETEVDVEKIETKESEVQETSSEEEIEVIVTEEQTDTLEDTPEASEETSEEKDGEEEEKQEEDDEKEDEDTQDTSEIDVSSLTYHDILKKLNTSYEKNHDRYDGYFAFVFPSEFYALYHKYEDDELDFIAVTYEVEDNEIHILEEIPITLVAHIRDIEQIISEKDEALVKASEKIENLKQEVAELMPFKEQIEQEAERKALEIKAQKQQELSSYALKSGYISKEEIETDDTIKALISEIDEAGIKQIIATRFMDSLNEKSDESDVETSETKISEKSISMTKNLNEDKVVLNPISLYLNN